MLDKISMLSLFIDKDFFRNACRPSIAGCLGARRGVPVDLTRHKGRAHCGGAIIIITRSEAESTIARTKNSRVQELGKHHSGDIAARQLPLCACRARQTAR